jgi:hypothetical protein
MRTILQLFIPCLFLLLPVYSWAQSPDTITREAPRPFCPIDNETRKITYDKIVTITDPKESRKEQLFNKAIAWAHGFYKNPTDVIREKNMDAGKIVCKARFKIMNKPDRSGFASDAGVVQYTLTILVKDGKYRCQLTDFNWKQLSYYPIERWLDSSAPSYNPSFAYYLIQVNDYAYRLMDELERFMTTRKKEKKDDW